MIAKLIDAIKTPQTLNLAETKEVNGHAMAVYKPRRFLPGKVYEIPDDPLLLKSLKNCTRQSPYTAELEMMLKNCGASYETKMCKSCGGRVKKIEYHVVEVSDETN